jgi:hypothetical protein
LFLFGPSSSFALAVEISLVAMVGLDVTAYFVLTFAVGDEILPDRLRMAFDAKYGR